MLRTSINPVERLLPLFFALLSACQITPTEKSDSGVVIEFVDGSASSTSGLFVITNNTVQAISFDGYTPKAGPSGFKMHQKSVDFEIRELGCEYCQWHAAHVLEKAFGQPTGTMVVRPGTTRGFSAGQGLVFGQTKTNGQTQFAAVVGSNETGYRILPLEKVEYRLTVTAHDGAKYHSNQFCVAQHGFVWFISCDSDRSKFKPFIPDA